MPRRNQNVARRQVNKKKRTQPLRTKLKTRRRLSSTAYSRRSAMIGSLLNEAVDTGVLHPSGWSTLFHGINSIVNPNQYRR